jgi:predicted DNA-binding transcriptional regulator
LPYFVVGNVQSIPSEAKVFFGRSITMITLTTDEVVLIKTILTALRGIKVRDIDRALLILSKHGASRPLTPEAIDSTDDA